METASAAAPEDQPSQIPPGEPPVIRRLPRGVDYTDIKMIIMSLPSPLTTLVWMGNPAADPIWAAFNGKTLRASDRRLRRREEALAALGQSAPENERTLVGGLRHQWVLLCMHEMNERALRKRTKWIIVRLIDPARLRPEFQPLGPLQQRIDVEVWKTSRKGPTLFDKRTLAPTVPTWGDPEIAWFDPDEQNRAYAELLRQHFPDVLSSRCGRRWRSKYAPPGWPLVTKYAVPALFEYLRPHYRVRHYQDHRQTKAAGHYSAQLRRDITELLQAELPHLATDLTIDRVTAAIQRHITRRGSR
jgi:hypothetical protein